MKTFSTLLFLCLFHSVHAQIINDPNLIVYYPFDGNGNDVSLNQFNATLIGSSEFTVDRFGVTGKCFSFNGQNNYFTINNPGPSFKPTTFPFTVSCWLKIPSNFQGQFLFFKNDFDFEIYSGIRGTVIPNGRVTISIENGGPIGEQSRRTKTGTTNIKDNKWHMVTCVVRGFSDMDIYIDCNNDLGNYTGSANSIFYSANNPGIIVAYDAVLGNTVLDYSRGDIDDLFFTKRALTQQDVNNLYSNPEVGINGSLFFCEGSFTELSAFGGINYLWSNQQISSTITVNQSGTYSVTITDQNQCVTSVEAEVVAVISPPISISSLTESCNGPVLLSVDTDFPFVWQDGSSSNPLLAGIGTYIATATMPGGCVGADTFSVSNSGVPPVADFTYTQLNNYTIDFVNTSQNADSYFWDFGFGNTSTGSNATFDFKQPGVYTVTLIATNDCGSDTVSYVINVTTLSLQLLNIHSPIKVYPNPTSDYLNIDLSDLRFDNAIFSIVNSAGQLLIRSSQTENNTQQIDLSALKSGYYLLMVETSKGVFRSHFIKH